MNRRHEHRDLCLASNLRCLPTHNTLLRLLPGLNYVSILLSCNLTSRRITLVQIVLTQIKTDMAVLIWIQTICHFDGVHKTIKNGQQTTKSMKSYPAFGPAALIE